VELHRVLRDAEVRGDLAVGTAGGEVLHDFELALRQRTLERSEPATAPVEHRRGHLRVGGDEIVRQRVQCRTQLVGGRGAKKHRSGARLEGLDGIAGRCDEDEDRDVDVVERPERHRRRVDENDIGIHDPHARGNSIVDGHVTDDVQIVESVEQRGQTDSREAVRGGDDDAQRPLRGLRAHRGKLQGWTHSGYHPRALNVRQTSLKGVLLLEPKVYSDERGFFIETYRIDRFRDLGIADTFVQDNHSRSQRGVLRGLHYQEPHPQGKLVRCTRGAMFDVAVDIRKGSPQFGKWFGVELSEANRLLLWVPPGFAHGFCALTDDCDVMYKVTSYYDAAADRSILWNDPDIGIEWPIADVRLSPKDMAAPRLRDAPLLPAY
jgi:dTDP-4-dehydrorhamnose 3,5-epimerase